MASSTPLSHRMPSSSHDPAKKPDSAPNTAPSTTDDTATTRPISKAVRVE